METLSCHKCGEPLEPIGDGMFQCRYCKAICREDYAAKQAAALSSAFDLEKQARIANIRRQLWDATHQSLLNMEEISRLASELKLIIDDDFFANFYQLATANMRLEANEEKLCEFLGSIDTEEHYYDVNTVVDFLLKIVTARNMLPICDLIERAYAKKDPETYSKFRTSMDAEMEKANSGLYEPSLSRDVFVCYASEDMDKVRGLVDFLEQGDQLSCFVALRNMQHGQGAANNYFEIIKKAIDNCRYFVFVSSKNSRNFKCTTVMEILDYINLSDRLREQPIRRIQYLADPLVGENKNFAERKTNVFFKGLMPCKTREEVVDRIFGWDEEHAQDAAATPTSSSSNNAELMEAFVRAQEQMQQQLALERQKWQQEQFQLQQLLLQQQLQQQQQKPAAEPKDPSIKEVKFCKFCGLENSLNARYCSDCGNDQFVSTREEYVRGRKEAAKEKRAMDRAEAEEKERSIRENTAIYVPTPKTQTVSVSSAIDDPRNRAGRPQKRSSDTRTVSVSEPIPTPPPAPRRHITRSPVTIGQRIVIPPEITELSVKSTYAYKIGGVTVNACIFLLNPEGKVISDNDLVFFNNDRSLNNSVKLVSQDEKGVETVSVNLNRVHSDIDRIRFTYVSISEDDRKVNLSMVKTVSLEIALGDNVYTYEFDALGREKSIIAFDLYKFKNSWKINLLARLSTQDLGGLCEELGVKTN